jgi:NAD(P)-dependent dehydrogenase (short-subunit alcohol dehydrogenase family)
MSTPFAKFDLTGRTALVTGGATGLGYCMARALAQSGARVIIAARRENLLKDACERLNKEPHVSNVTWRALDLNDRANVDDFARFAITTYGGIDVYVGNAGGSYTEPMEQLSLDTVDEALQTNLTSNIQFAKAFLPGMVERRFGRFIYSSSIAAVTAAPGVGNFTYSASKAALDGFARTIAGDYGVHNITANSIILGFYRTDIFIDAVAGLRAMAGEAAARAFEDSFRLSTALGRFAEPAEIEGLVQLLASDAGSYITGASIAADGGMSMMMRPLQGG